MLGQTNQMPFGDAAVATKKSREENGVTEVVDE